MDPGIFESHHALNAIWLPIIVLYALMFVSILRRFTLFPAVTTRNEDIASTPRSPRYLSPRGTELTLGAIILDSVQLADSFQSWFVYSAADQNRAAMVVAALLFIMHLQAFLFLERAEERAQAGETRRSTVMLRSMAIGVVAVFTNAITITALLR